jgi:hypothetical protein
VKQYQRRETQQFPYFKLATFDPISFCFRDGKVAFKTETDARNAATRPGKYRVSVVTESGRTDLDGFDVG